QTKRRKQP
ncbi:H+ symporter family protein, partial [Escherichia coli 95.0183]